MTQLCVLLLRAPCDFQGGSLSRPQSCGLDLGHTCNPCNGCLPGLLQKTLFALEKTLRAGLLILSLLQGDLALSAPKAASSLKIAIAQINPSVGDFEGNFKKLEERYLQAVRLRADMITTPEGLFPGYPAGDLMDSPDFIDRADQMVERVIAMTKGKPTAILLGHITRNPRSSGRELVNVASLIDNGRVTYRHEKILLPTYDVFDDSRYFDPGKSARVTRFRGFRLAIMVCEDWWFADKHRSRHLYHRDPSTTFKRENVDMALSLSVSPFHIGKPTIREAIHAEVSRRLNVPFIYTNAVGGIDQIQMDGTSFVTDSRGNVVIRLDPFSEDFEVVEISRNGEVKPSAELKSREDLSVKPDIELVLQALLQGLRDYMKKTNQKRVVLGLSGGLDSAVTAALATLALGPENVIVLKMPSAHSSEGSLADADKSVEALGIPENNVYLIPIQAAVDAHLESLEREFARKGLSTVEGSYVPVENLQARVRMINEQFVANSFPGVIKIMTSNKSEIAMGYSTVYGDSTGKIAILGDLYKTEVWELGRYLNHRFGKELVPESTLNKPPSAELRPGQLTANEIPPYPVLDPLLRDLIEEKLSPEALKEKYSGHLDPNVWPDWVQRVLDRYQTQEWKRDIGTVYVKVHRRSFGIGRRVPISGVKHQRVQSKIECGTVAN